MAAKVSEVVRRPSRLRALAGLEANAESSAEALDRIARTACRVLTVPVVLVNLVGADRQRFVGCEGPEPWPSMREMPITAGFCPFALGAAESYSFADARDDPTLAANAAVEQFGVTAYAGVPLRAADGEPIGTLCAIDYEPHAWSDDELALLADFAAGVMTELRLLSATRLVALDRARLHALTALSSALVPAATAGEVTDEVMRAVDRLHPNAVWLLMLDESGDTLRTAAAAGPDAQAAARHADVPLAAPLAPAEVVRTGQPDFSTTRAEVRDRFDVLDAGAVAVLPLTTGEHHVGALAMCFADERSFSADDRAYLEAVGGISGLALARSVARG